MAAIPITRLAAITVIDAASSPRRGFVGPFSLYACEGFKSLHNLKGGQMNLTIRYRKLTINLAVSAAFLAVTIHAILTGS